MNDGKNAKDKRGNIYKIESISLGIGIRRQTISYTKGFLKAGGECRAEVLSNGKLNIIN